MATINSLPSEILVIIFNTIPTLSELFSISTTCRLWHSIIINEWFLQQRFERFKKEHIIGHWRFEDASHIGHDSSRYTKDNYSIVGHPIQSDCFLGKSIQLDGRSAITIPVKDLPRYQTDYFAISCWIYCDKTFLGDWQVAVGSWYDWTNSWFHLGFYGNETLHNQALISKEHQYQFNCNSKTKVETKRWYYVVIQVSREKQEIYVDGKWEGQVDMTNPDNRSELWGISISPKEKWEDMKMDMPQAICIGSKSPDAGYTFWYGQVTDVCICTQWFHPKEIEAIYQSKVTIDKLNFGKFVFNSITKKSLDQDEI